MASAIPRARVQSIDPAVPKAGCIPELKGVDADHPPGVASAGVSAVASGRACGCCGAAGAGTAPGRAGDAVDDGAGRGAAAGVGREVGAVDDGAGAPNATETRALSSLMLPAASCWMAETG
jgi:hypothetical protein